MRIVHTRNFSRHQRGGYSTAELLVYTFILGFILAFVASGVVALHKSVVRARSSRDVNVSAVTGLERMVREIKDATSVSTTTSTLGTSPGKLVLTTTNASTTGGTMDFSILGGMIMLHQGSNGTTTLTAANVTISRLVFYAITSTNSQSVRVELTAQTTTTPARTFYDTAVLRESYL